MKFYHCRLTSLALLAAFTVATVAVRGIGAAQASAKDSDTRAVNLAGRAVDPLKNPAGQITVLLFVRTDCPIANRYAPEIRRLGEEFHGRAKFWLIYPDSSESPARISEHLKQFDLNFPALRDVNHALVAEAHATITPEAAVFDVAGQLKYHGRIDNWFADFGRSRPKPTTHDLEDAIRAVLEGRVSERKQSPAVGCYIADLR